ncbi:hypothetical protein KR018_004614 [Drosophila ironensis]|nr:hypothetical protein KR018_004614 [Drosophila ironensis]
MAVVTCKTRGNIRLWAILALVTTALLLLWRNLRLAQQIIPEPDTIAYNADDYVDYVEAVVQREISPRTRELSQLLKCRNRSLRFQRLQHGEYWLLQNLVIGEKSRNIGCAEALTYTTIGDYTFFDNLLPVVERWLAPVSFAIHTPGYDLNATLDAIQYVRNCLEGSDIIRDWVTFHVYFPNKHMPEYVPLNEAEVLRRPFICSMTNGTQIPPPYTLVPRSESYKERSNLTYPINVGRNIARQAANTHFILASDIELYPSLGFVDQFLDMVARNHSVLAMDPRQPRRVYPLAVFEIEDGAMVPRDKFELLNLWRKHLAQGFHQKFCSSCHKIPNQESWLEREFGAHEPLQVFSQTLREKEFRSWEPFYVSDNTEPFFDERVTWEGQSNKRIQVTIVFVIRIYIFQNYAMCLMGYEYHVLYPAFLVHSPGIKKTPKAKSARKVAANKMTKFIRDKIEPEYRVLFGNNFECRT